MTPTVHGMTRSTPSAGIAWGLMVGFAAGALGVLLALVGIPAVSGGDEASTVELFVCTIVTGIAVGTLVGIARRRRFKRQSHGGGPRTDHDG